MDVNSIMHHYIYGLLWNSFISSPHWTLSSSGRLYSRRLWLVGQFLPSSAKWRLIDGLSLVACPKDRIWRSGALLTSLSLHRSWQLRLAGWFLPLLDVKFVSWSSSTSDTDVDIVILHPGESDKAIDDYLDIDSNRSQTIGCPRTKTNLAKNCTYELRAHAPA